jgi:hypothetical protein
MAATPPAIASHRLAMVEKMASKRTAIGLGPLRTARGGVRFVVFRLVDLAAGRRLF